MSSTPNHLAIAEFRAAITDRRSAYPIALSGINVRTLHFYEEPHTGHHVRRYIAGGNQPDSGIFPLEQARQDMKELQHPGNSSIVVEWTFSTVDEYEARIAEESRQKKAADEAEAARLKALDEAKQTAAEASKLAEILAKPGAMPVVPPAAKKKRDVLRNIAAIAGSGEKNQ